MDTDTRVPLTCYRCGHVYWVHPPAPNVPTRCHTCTPQETDPWQPFCEHHCADGDYICTRDTGHGGWCEEENLEGEITHRWKANT